MANEREQKRERERGGSGRKEEHARWKQGQETRARLVSSPLSVTEKEEGRGAPWKTWKEAMERRTQKNDLSPSARTREGGKRADGTTNKSNATGTWNKSNERAVKQPAGSRRARVITVLVPSGADVL